MAVTLTKWIVIANITLPPMTASTPVAGEPGTGGAAGFGSTSGAPGTPTTAYDVKSLMLVAGQPLLLDSGGAGVLYNILNGLGAIRAYVPGTDDVSHAGIGN